MNESMKRYEELAKGMEEMRETVNAVVAGLKADGFSDEQARWLVVGIFTHHLSESKEDGS